MTTDPVTGRTRALAEQMQDRAAAAYQAARDAREEYNRTPSPGMRAIAIVQAARGASLSQTARIMRGVTDDES